MKEADLLSKFKVGQKYSDPGLLSASKDPKVADLFMNKIRHTEGNVKVKFFINTKEGAYINDLSHFSKRFKDVNPKYTSDQQEILFGSKTQFEVFDMEKTTNIKGETVYEIYMNQL